MIEIKDIQQFNETVAKEPGVILTDFWASWCGPCRMLGSVLDEISNDTPNLKIIKINVDDAPDIADKLNVQSVPTLILFKNGNELSSKSGFLSKSALLKWIDENSN
ncbi:MAG: thioredoxin [Holosporales bacterium]|jgi:thioredoxin 1|nr:thioredoxin [Holosporales bacterium]